MLRLDRHRRLLDLIEGNGSVRTAEAARELGVTEETVRRDFEKLEAEGALQRSHGGAVKHAAARQEHPTSARANQNIAEKRLIAAAAVARIRPGQTILFDASTTALEVAQLLPDQPLHVLTHALPTALALAEKPAIQVTLLGGSMLRNSLSCTGWAAEAMIEATHIDCAYLSCTGIDALRGASEVSEDQARLKKWIIRYAEEICLLADDSKVGLRSNHYFAHPSEIGRWITNRTPSAEVAQAFSAAGTVIETAEK